MSEHVSYEQSKKNVVKGLYLLAVVTLIEVFFSLLGKGYVIPGLEKYWAVFALASLVIIILSLYKAYFIVYEFMHMRYEVKGLAMTVLLPTLLLVWAIIAFFQEGGSWKYRRELIKEKNKEQVEPNTGGQQGYRLPDDVYVPNQLG